MRNGFGPLVVVAFPVLALVIAVRPPMLRQNSDAPLAAQPAQPFHGAAVYAGIVLPDLLLVTQNPATVLNTFAFKSGPTPPTLLDRIYPALARVPVAAYGRATSVETMLLQQPSAVLTWKYAAPALSAVGLPAVGVATASERDAMDRVRLYARLVNEPGRAGQLISAYRGGFAALASELKPEKIGHKQRILMLNLNGGFLSSNNGHAMVWHRAGLVEAQKRSFGSIDEESVLAIDPDILILSGDLTLPAVEAMPGLQQLRAVREGRAYRLPPALAAFPWNIVDLPYYARWLAELAYPDRLAPALRPMLRDAYARQLSYHCTERDLDHALGVEENRGAKGYTRFSRKTTGTIAPGQPGEGIE